MTAERNVKRRLYGRRFATVWTTVMAAAVTACASSDPGDATATEGPAIEVRDDLGAVFADAGVAGTFVLFDIAGDRLVLVDSARAHRRFVPASTFKLANSLIALDVGAVADIDEVVPYGGQPQTFAHWERDMPLKEAFPASNVAIYQELARRVGLERMREWVDRLDYGNETIGDVPDRFWLDGPLEISAVEQTRFIARLAAGELPAGSTSQSAVREIARIETTPEYELFAKTGWRFDATPQIGWWVGWVEREGNSYAFALNIDMDSDDDARQRIPIGRQLLERLGVLGAPPSSDPARGER